MVNYKVGEIDLNKKVVQPKLFLCKPNKEIIQNIIGAYEIQYNIKLGSLNELNFQVPYYIEKNHEKIENPVIEQIKGRFLVKLVLGYVEEYFIINKEIKEDSDTENCKVECFSLGFELNDKNIRDYSATSKDLRELVNDMLVDTIWKTGYVDSEFILKKRGFEVSSGTSLEQIVSIAKTFNALIVWHTDKRVIDFVKPENYGEDKGFSIKYGKYLQSLNIENNTEGIVTRLKVYGKEDITIRGINITGTNYIESFNYFLYPYQEKLNYEEIPYSSVKMLDTFIEQCSTTLTYHNNKQYVRLFSEDEKSVFFDVENSCYEFSSIIRLSEMTNKLSILVDYVDENNYKIIEWISKEGYPSLTKYLSLKENVDGVIKELVTYPIDGFSRNVDYIVKVERDKTLLKMSIDNRLIFSYETEEAKSSKLGFNIYNQDIHTRNVVYNKKEYDIINSSDYMSDELAHHIIAYEERLKKETPTFENILAKKEALQKIITTKENDLHSLKTELKKMLDSRDILNTRIASKQDEISKADNVKEATDLLKQQLVELIKQRDDKLVEISGQETKVKAKENEIIIEKAKMTEVDNQIAQLKVVIAIENNFPKKLMDERTQYVIEGEWQDQNIDNPKDLLKEGLEVFKEKSKEKITLSIDVVNLLSMVTEQRNWDKLNIGDSFKIRHERFRLNYKAKITEISYNFESETISLVITNLNDLYSNKNAFMDMIYNSNSTSSQVNKDSWVWDLGLENKGSINEIINNFWDANKNAIVGAKDQVVEISDRGLIIRDPKDPKTYLVGINAMLAITDDGGNTWKHAITSKGIVGEYIYGKIFMGVNLALEDEDGVLKFQGSKGEIFDRNKRLVMKLGLVSENPDTFGMWSFNDITRVKVTDREGFVIEKKQLFEDETKWKKTLWTDVTDGTLYTENMVAQNIKITNNIGDVILDSENGIFDLGFFEKIVMDNKLTSVEKMRIITELYQIYSGYKIIVEQALKYQKSSRDNTIDFEGAYNPSTGKFPESASSTNRYSVTPIEKAYNDLINYMKQYLEITLNDPLNIDINHPKTETTSEIADRAVFILMFKNYYDEYKKLKNAIEDMMFYTGINMGEYYNNLIMSEFGFVAVRSDGKYRAYLNATNGLALQKWESGRWVSKIYGSIGNSDFEDGTLIAEDLVAKRLRIVNGNLGTAILLDWESGITIYGDRGEEIRLNKDMGFYISVHGEKRIWIDNDGTIRARKLIIEPEGGESDLVLDEETDAFISDLLVNSLKSIPKGTKAGEIVDYAYVKNNFIRLQTGTSSADDTTKWSIELIPDGSTTIPEMRWGAGQTGSRNSTTFMKHNSEGFSIVQTNSNGRERKIIMNESNQDSILMESDYGTIRLKSGTRITLQVNDDNYISITPNGVKIVGKRIDQN